MTDFARGDVHLHYDDHGSGFPVLLIARGGMRSEAGYWSNTPWNPIEQLAPRHRVIAMDPRDVVLEHLDRADLHRCLSG